MIEFVSICIQLLLWVLALSGRPCSRVATKHMIELVAAMDDGTTAEPCRPSGEFVANPGDNPLSGWPSTAGPPKALGPPKAQAEGKAKRQKVINVLDSAEADPPQSGATCNADAAFEGTGCASGDAPELASLVASASAQGSVVDLTAVSDSTAVVGKPPPERRSRSFVDMPGCKHVSSRFGQAWQEGTYQKRRI